LQSQLSRLDTQFYRTISYEEFTENPKKFVKPLSEYLDIPVDNLERGIRNVRKNPPKWQQELPADEQEFLTSFFDLSRRTQWPLFTDPSLSILGYKRNGG
jgi:hypothetical protein